VSSMKIGMMNDPAKNILDEITFAGENKFDFIDLTIEPPEAQIEDINVRKILSVCNRYTLGIIGHTNFYLPWASPIKRLKKASMLELTEHLKVFSKLGVKYASIHSHWYQPRSFQEEIIERIIESLQQIVIIARQYGITMMLENQPNGFLHKPESLLPIFRNVENLLFHLDVGHAQVAGGMKNLTREFLKLFRNKLAHIHFSDNKGKSDDHLPIGAGIVDWEDIIRQLKKIHYDKTITLEVFVKDQSYVCYSKEKIRHLWDTVTIAGRKTTDKLEA